MRKSSLAKPGAAQVLLVADSSDGLKARKSVLEEQGFSIATASNGEEAIEVLSKGKFDLLVTDYKMPTMSGIELIRRARPQHPTLSVILLAGFAEALALDEKSTGADVVIAKGSHEIPNLLRSATRLLARKTPRRPPASQKETSPKKPRSKSG